MDAVEMPPNRKYDFVGKRTGRKRRRKYSVPADKKEENRDSFVLKSANNTVTDKNVTQQMSPKTSDKICTSETTPIRV